MGERKEKSSKVIVLTAVFHCVPGKSESVVRMSQLFHPSMDFLNPFTLKCQK